MSAYYDVPTISLRNVILPQIIADESRITTYERGDPVDTPRSHVYWFAPWGEPGNSPDIRHVSGDCGEWGVGWGRRSDNVKYEEFADKLIKFDSSGNRDITLWDISLTCISIGLFARWKIRIRRWSRHRMLRVGLGSL